MLIYKVSPPRASLLFAPATFYRTPDFKSSSTRPKPGYIQDMLLYAGDREEIATHLFPDIDRLRVRLNNATRPALAKRGFATDADKLIVIFVNAADQAQLPGFVATVYSFDAAEFERTPSNEFISRKPVRAIGVEQLSMPEILRDWKIQVIAVSNVAETDTLLRQDGIECSRQTPRKPSPQFRPLAFAEEPAGYQVICDTVFWLREKGIKLWEKPLPREVYAIRQQRGENFGLFAEGKLAAIVSLVRGAPKYWEAELPEPQIMWLSTLTTANAFRGQGWGRVTVDRALAFLAERGETAVCLDCKPGWLVEYYRKLGFTAVTQRALQIPHGTADLMQVTLMRKQL